MRGWSCHPQPVLHAMRNLAESGQSRLAVVKHGALVGLLCGRDVLNLIEIRAGLAPPPAAEPDGEGAPVGPGVRSFSHDGRAHAR